MYLIANTDTNHAETLKKHHSLQDKCSTASTLPGAGHHCSFNQAVGKQGRVWDWATLTMRKHDLSEMSE